MPPLADHHSAKFVKLIYIGDSGAGKTGSLISLVQAGYQLKILDMDNGLDPLRKLILRHCPERIAQVDYETCRDEPKATPQGPVVRHPKAYVEALKLLEKWSDGSDPSEWGEDTIFVLDTLSALGRQALWWAMGMNPSTKDPRQWYKSAQDACENNLDLLTSEGFRCNVIVISHVQYQERMAAPLKGYAKAIGSALGPHIPKYFNTLILAETSGSGKNAKRRIKTLPTSMIDLKNPVPWEFQDDLPLESGLATIFAKLKENVNAT